MAYFGSYVDQGGNPGLTYLNGPYEVADTYSYGYIPGTTSMQYDGNGGMWMGGAPNILTPTLSATGEFRRFGPSERIEQKVNDAWTPINWSGTNSMTGLNAFWNMVNAPGTAEYNALLGKSLGGAGTFDTTDDAYSDALKAAAANWVVGGPMNSYYGPSVSTPGFNADALAAAHLTPQQKLEQNAVTLKDPTTGELKAYFIPSRLFDSVTYGNAKANETYGNNTALGQLDQFGVRASLPGLGGGIMIDPTKVSGISSSEIARTYQAPESNGFLEGLIPALALFGGIGAFGALPGLGELFGGEAAAATGAGEGLSAAGMGGADLAGWGGITEGAGGLDLLGEGLSSLPSMGLDDLAQSSLSGTGTGQYVPDFGGLSDAQAALDAANNPSLFEGWGSTPTGSVPGMDTLGSTNPLSSWLNTQVSNLTNNPLGTLSNALGSGTGSAARTGLSQLLGIPDNVAGGALGLLSWLAARDQRNNQTSQNASNVAALRSPAFNAPLNPTAFAGPQMRNVMGATPSTPRQNVTPTWNQPIRRAEGGALSRMSNNTAGPSMSGYAAGGTKGQDDKIPALLSDGEYVLDADIVAALGDGNNAAGAAALDKMRENIRRHKRSAPANKIPPKAKSPEAYMKGAK